MLIKGVLLAGVAATAFAGPVKDKDMRKAEQRCSQLAKTAKAKFKDITVLTTQVCPDNTTFSDPSATIPQYSASVPELPVKFELWMPLKWSGRFSMVGNGGMAGGVNFPDMWGPIARYGMAVASTDTGHTGGSGDGTWLINGPETQIDFGWRAVHLTAVYSKQIVKDFYKDSAKHSYWIGCSSGGKQGLREIQQFPNTFDGVIAGASAQWWPHLNAQTYRINAFVNTIGSEGFMAPKDYAVVGAEVMKQCDKLDGLEDGIITNPRKCKPDLAPVTCTTAGQTACITRAQVSTMKTIWANWTSSDGDFLFWGFEPGAEGLSAFSVNGVPYGPGPDYFNYQVLNNTQIGPLDISEPELERLIDIADATDPGQTNAIKADLSPYFKSGGKLWTYTGFSDTLIPSGMTPWYYEEVRKVVPKKLFDDSFQMFMVPGMAHCRGGVSASSFGGPGQRSTQLKGVSLPAKDDVEHDMVRSMIEWVEKGRKPRTLIGTKYVNDDINAGISFQRPLCGWPREAKYIGGDVNAASSFKCV
ncbi:hypothetical protein OIO90_003599 [Microbotryomycetes sp. JL221]|nr:hypothetical protein OIO90_003599 [Microbotryomycetes sp. JL221]